MEISLIGKRVRVPKLVSDWLDFDRAFSTKVMAGEWGYMTRKELGYAEIQTAILALAVAACGLIDKGPSKPPELPAVQPSIGLITEATAAKDPVALAGLNRIRSLSGDPSNCKPQEIVVNSAKGPEIIGVCRIVRKDGLEGSQIVSRESAQSSEIINEPLLGYRQSDGRIIVGYKHSDRPNGISQVMVIYKDGSSEYIYGNGLRIAFDVKQTQQAGLFENFIGKLIEPGEVAQAAEAALAPTPKPTEAPTLVPAKIISPINTEVYIPTDISVLPKCEEAASETIKWINEYVVQNPDKDFSPEIQSTYNYFGTNAWAKEAYAYVGGLVKVAIGGELNGVNQGKVDIGDGSYAQCVVFFYKDAAGKLVIDYALAGQKINGQWYGPLVGNTVMVESEFVTLVQNKLGKRLHMQGAVVGVPDNFKPNFPVDPKNEPRRAMWYDLMIYLAQQQSNQVKNVTNSMSGVDIKNNGGFVVMPSFFDFGY